jgi:excisionase family DNA binding protein
VSSGSRQKAIRVTLSFGDNSDAALVRALREQRPYDRAKYLRKLIGEGLRSRLRELGFTSATAAPRPKLMPAAPALQTTSSPQAEPLGISAPGGEQLAEILQVPVTWIEQQAREGNIPSLPFGRRRRYRRSAVEAAIKQRNINNIPQWAC